MFNPDLRGVLKNHLSRYSLVTATAKRAREISENAEENKIIMTEKPVSVAIDEIIKTFNGKIDRKQMISCLIEHYPEYVSDIINPLVDNNNKIVVFFLRFIKGKSSLSSFLLWSIIWIFVIISSAPT